MSVHEATKTDVRTAIRVLFPYGATVPAPFRKSTHYSSRRGRLAGRAKAACEEKPVLSPKAVNLLKRRRAVRRRQDCDAKALAKETLTQHQLLQIAARSSRAELMAIRQVGRTLVGEIETWLVAHGRRFRSDPLQPGAALAQALDHIEAMLDGQDDAFLAAFAAVPELRRSLGPSIVRG